MKCYKVHGKVDGIIQEFCIANPTNLVFNTAMLPGDLEGPDGKKLLVTRTMINFPNRMQIIVEESMEELIKIFEGTSD